MSKSLADILGWEEGAVYKYGSNFFKIKHDRLLSSLTGKQGEWYIDASVSLNELTYLMKATKAESKRYYLKHKFLYGEGLNYLTYNCSIDRLYITGRAETSRYYQTQFTDKEIEEIEATGFDLCNFERVEVEYE